MSEPKPQNVQLPIKSKRLLLKDLTVAEAEAVFQYRSLPQVTIFQGWAPISVAEVTRFIEEDICHTLNQPDTWFQLGIFMREGQALIGDLGIHFLYDDHQSDPSHGTRGQGSVVEIGITIAPQFQGKGFATEAVGCGLDFLFDQLNISKVVASVDPKNQKSMALMENIGFHLKGIHKNAVLFREEWTDDAVFEMTPQNWRNPMKPKG